MSVPSKVVLPAVSEDEIRMAGITSRPLKDFEQFLSELVKVSANETEFRQVADRYISEVVRTEIGLPELKAIAVALEHLEYLCFVADRGPIALGTSYEYSSVGKVQASFLKSYYEDGGKMIDVLNHYNRIRLGSYRSGYNFLVGLSGLLTDPSA